MKTTKTVPRIKAVLIAELTKIEGMLKRDRSNGCNSYDWGNLHGARQALLWALRDNALRPSRAFEWGMRRKKPKAKAMKRRSRIRAEKFYDLLFNQTPSFEKVILQDWHNPTREEVKQLRFEADVIAIRRLLLRRYHPKSPLPERPSPFSEGWIGRVRTAPWESFCHSDQCYVLSDS